MNPATIDSRSLQGRYKSISKEFDLWAPKFHTIITGLMKRYFDVKYDDLVERMVGIIATPTTSKVLEIGVGTGLVASAIARNLEPDGARMCGIDVTQAMLDKAGENIRKFGLEDRMEVRFGADQSIPYGDGEFDVVYTHLCFHHFHTRKSFKEIMRVLKPGGRFVTIDLGALEVWRTLRGRLYYNCLARMRYLTTPNLRDEFFAKYYTRAEWDDLLAAYPFKKISIEDISKCTGRITRENILNIIKYKSMGTPPLWLIQAEYNP